ncbi:MAG: cation:proton antiporter [Candidatus Bathyarchaeia archaeon]|nr:cation:proton antiporter [Candidatus Bathyarchaeia archaeon]
MNPEVIAFLVAAVIIILGFLGEEFFNRTSIPDSILLLLFGVLLGPIFQLFAHEELLAITPYFAALALIIILFDGGLNMDIREAVKNSPRALVLAITGWIINVLVTAVFCKVFLGWRLLNGLLLGSIVGGGSSIIVIALIRKLKVSEKIETVLSLESILTDVLCTVGAFTMINILVSISSVEAVSSGVDLYSAIGSVGAAFGVGILVGLSFGVAWIVILERIKGKPNAYMLTLAMLFLTFVVATNLEGNGALSALFFGLIIGNSRHIAKRLKFRTTISIDNSVRDFHSQISFLIRSFFFVFTGLLFSLSSFTSVLFGLLLSATFLGIRFVVVKMASVKSELGDYGTLMTVMFPRGLAAAVLASIPLTSGVPGSIVFPEIAFIVILTTIIITTVGVAVIKKRESSSSSTYNTKRNLLY